MSELSLAAPSGDTVGEADDESDDDDDEFFDAAPDHTEAATSPAAVPASPATNGSVVVASPTSGGALPAPKRRTKLPAVMFDRSNVSLWTVIKDFVGKDLSKIAVPVYFNEPLSFLQKFSEDLEYYQLLDQASKGTCPPGARRAGAQEGR